ncbi:MAG: gliding motility lipoprotein GldD [Flavobacteriales bacterium]|nr:gliding motility lipoprotein GldD [Flavobacteriales bacterium]
MKRTQKYILPIIGVVVLFGSCQKYTPKPHGFPKIEFPKKEYSKFDEGCSYTFDIPSYAIAERDTHESALPCWFNIRIPQFGATVYLSYRHLQSLEDLDTLREEAFKLANRNNIKADAIEDQVFADSAHQTFGMTYDLLGPSATPFNFYLTDVKKHYLRGSFYFDYKTNQDSVAPIYSFLKEDLQVLLKTLEWK